MSPTRSGSGSQAIFEDAVLRAYWVVRNCPDGRHVLVEEAVAHTRKESGPFESDNEAMVFIASRRAELHQALKEFVKTSRPKRLLHQCRHSRYIPGRGAR